MLAGSSRIHGTDPSGVVPMNDGRHILRLYRWTFFCTRLSGRYSNRENEAQKGTIFRPKYGHETAGTHYGFPRSRAQIVAHLLGLEIGTNKVTSRWTPCANKECLSVKPNLTPLV